MQSRREFLGQAFVLAGGLLLPIRVAEGASKAPAALSYDVIIYGGTSAAVTAAVQTARMGKSVAIVCPETHLGGMTTSGLGWTDTKQVAAVGGLAREFYHRIWLYYQNPDVWTRQTRSSYAGVISQSGPAMDDKRQAMWTFEPRVAEDVMEKWLAEEKIAIYRGHSLDRKKGVVKQGARIVEIRTTLGRRFQGKMFIDAGYEGDLMAACGVTYRIGRDSAQEYDEPLNGVRFMVKGVDRYYSEDEYRGVDPYVTPGDSKSGLISGIEGPFEAGPKLGEADHRLQSFNYRLCMTDDPGHRVYITKPHNYDERLYEILFRLYAAGQTSSFGPQPMPNGKTDTNAKGAMSFDFIGGDESLAGHWNYSDADDATRSKIVAAHRNYQQGLLWTLQNHPRIPASVRADLGKWGLDAEEFSGNSHWPYQLYVREARRMVGQTMVTQHHVQQKPGYEVTDSIGLGSYSLDSHIVRRVIVDRQIRSEGGFYLWWTTPYPIPYGAITPKRAEAANLLAPVTLSATHAAFGSFRMEPTYMILGQAAATAAVLAINRHGAVQDVDYTALSARLKEDGQVLTARRLPAV